MSGVEGELASVQIETGLPPAAAGAVADAATSFAALGNHNIAALERPSSRAAATGAQPVERPEDVQLARSLARAVRERGAGGAAVLARQPTSTEDPPAEEEATEFTPTVIATAGGSAAKLGAATDVGVGVDNSADAPPDTTYEWSWETLDENLEAVGEAQTGAAAMLQVKPLAVGTFSATPQLSYVVDQTNYSLTGPAVDVEVGDITVTWDELDITAGPRSPDTPRGVLSVYVGDTLTLRAHAADVEDPDGIGVETSIGSPGTAQPKGAWSGLTYEWTWVQENSGDFDFEATMAAPGGGESLQMVGFTAFTDLLQWSLSCKAAETKLGAQYDAAVTRLDGAAANVDGAVKTFNESMEGKAKVDKDRDKQTELLINLLLTPVAGAGAGAIKDVMRGEGDAATTAVTDTFKFAVKTVGAMGGMGIATTFSPTAPKGGTAAAGGMSKQMKALALRIRGEKDNVTANMAGLYDAARLAAVKQPDAEVSLDDPMATIPMNDEVLTAAAAMPDKSEQEHLKVLWHDWLPSAGDYISFEYVNFSHEDGEWMWVIEDFVRKGAAQCGEDAMDWATTYHMPGDENLRTLAWRAAKGDKAGEPPAPAPAAPPAGGKGGTGGAGGAGGAPGQ